MALVAVGSMRERKEDYCSFYLIFVAFNMIGGEYYARCQNPGVLLLF